MSENAPGPRYADAPGTDVYSAQECLQDSMSGKEMKVTEKRRNKMIVIGQETAKDFDAVHYLVKEAFAGAQHSEGNEQDLVAALRKSHAFVPELSLVAELDGKIAGYILFTEAKVGNDTVLVLAPLAVVPERQNKGVGGALITAGHRIAKELGYAYSLVLGSETYYPRFGYLSAELFGIEVPVGMPAINFMAVPLHADAPPVSGVVKYAKEFAL